jgi:5'-nucleotidase
MRKILYIDMDNVLVDFPSALPKLSEELLAEYEGRLDEVPEIFSLMEPLEGAIDAYRELSEKFDTYILSTAPLENPSAWSDKLEWVKKHLGQEAYKRLILSHNKHLNHGDYLVDDRLKNGVDKFRGEHIHFATFRFPDWKTVVEYLITEPEDNYEQQV